MSAFAAVVWPRTAPVPARRRRYADAGAVLRHHRRHRALCRGARSRRCWPRIAPGIVWIAAFLAMLLGLDRLFRPDHEDGSLILLRQADLPLSAVVAAKLIAHWLVSALPLILAVAAPGGAAGHGARYLLAHAAVAAAGHPGLGRLRRHWRRRNRVDPARRADRARSSSRRSRCPVLIFGVGSITAPANRAPPCCFLRH